MNQLLHKTIGQIIAKRDHLHENFVNVTVYP